jgi:hypothetical protein
MTELNNLKNEAIEDTRITESSIIKSSMENGLIICKWIDRYKQIAIDLKKVHHKRDNMELLLYLYYSGKASKEQLDFLKKSKPFGLKIDNRSDIERFIKGSMIYQEIDIELEELSQILKFIDEVIQTLKFQNNKISNIIAYKKFLNGE